MERKRPITDGFQIARFAPLLFSLLECYFLFALTEFIRRTTRRIAFARLERVDSADLQIRELSEAGNSMIIPRCCSAPHRVTQVLSAVLLSVRPVLK